MIAFGKTDVGIDRQTNQDYFFVSVKPVGNLPNLFIVADGMGGHKAGDVASKTAVECVLESIQQSKKDVVSAMEEAINKANSTLIDKASSNPDWEGMGTTIVMATVIEDTVYIANIGDSRLYLIGEDIQQITRDHSFVEEMVNLGKIDKESAKNHYRKNVLTRALGVDKDVVADYFDIKINENDIILMCTDGLTNMLDDEDIRLLVSRDDTLEEIAEQLINEANINGGKDNITSVICRKSRLK